MMNKILLLIGVIIIGIVLFVGGVFLGQVNAQDFQPGSMMGGYNGNSQTGYGMMGSGMMNGGMMGGFDGLVNVDPLTIEQAETAVSNYLAGLIDNNLILGEIMIFDNHAYAQVLNAESGLGAFELLVDPVTGYVFPEPGPNMMWNTEYGMMIGQEGGMMGSGVMGMMGSGMMSGLYGGMMGSGMMNGQFDRTMGNFGIDPNTETNVTEEDAIGLAQEYLDANLPGTTADDHADSFPGYYTIHVEQDGNIIGMLSVNGYNGQVFFHHWHGEFIEMSEEDHS
jgi:hypothetical protein